MHFTQHKLREEFIWNEAMAPVTLRVAAKRVPNWIISDGIPRQPLNDRSGVYRGSLNKKVEKITLIPYGFTRLRITAFPVAP